MCVAQVRYPDFLFIGSDVTGRGDNQQLGSLLMQSFLHTLGGLKPKPETVVFMNSGVRLVTVDSSVLGEHAYPVGVDT